MLRKIFKFKAIYIVLYILGKGKGQNVARKASIHQFRSPVHNKPIKQEQRKGFIQHCPIKKRNKEIQ